MNIWSLPKALTVGGREYKIRYQFQAVLDILSAYNDPDLEKDEKTEVMLSILYPDFRKIPPCDIPEAVNRACEFIDCGNSENRERKPGPRLMDWDQDAHLIIPAVNGVAHREIREIPDLHWWTFMGWFMDIRDSTFSTVLRIRRKKSRGEKLDKWEQQYYRDNQEIVELKKRFSAQEQEEIDRFMRWLM